MNDYRDRFTFFNSLRGLLFAVVFSIPTLIFLGASIMFAYARMPNTSYKAFMLWSASLCFLLNLICGIRYKVIGKNNLPPGNCILAPQHQSLWETIALCYILRRKKPVYVTKTELGDYPIIGTALDKSHFIVLATFNSVSETKDYLEEGFLNQIAKTLVKHSIIIFPEGQRNLPEDANTRIKRGIKRISAHKATKHIPIVPVSADPGKYWPIRKLPKAPGTIIVKIHKPVKNDIINYIKDCYQDNSNN